MKRKLQINDRRRALGQPKRDHFKIATSRLTHCKSCFKVLFKGQKCGVCDPLRPYQQELLNMIARDMVMLPLTVRKYTGKTIVFPLA